VLGCLLGKYWQSEYCGYFYAYMLTINVSPRYFCNRRSRTELHRLTETLPRVVMCSNLCGVVMWCKATSTTKKHLSNGGHGQLPTS